MLKILLKLTTLLATISMLTGCAQSNPASDYTVDINPDDFVAVVSNAYFPLIPGSKWVYTGNADEGTERIEVEVLADTKEVMGVTATVVRDRVHLNEELIEETYDWYAQDLEGNVWYLGEEVSNYENGQYAGNAGSWEAGVDGALPGIIMFADPAAHLGETYRQEFYKGNAEDMADLLSASERVTVPYGSFEAVVQTKDYTPLEPDLLEYKYYAAGIGMVQEINPKTGEEVVLVEFSSP